MSIAKFWRLDSPLMCRDFLKQVRIGPDGARIEFLQQRDGKQIAIDDASDRQVLEVANEIADALKYRDKA